MQRADLTINKQLDLSLPSGDYRINPLQLTQQDEALLKSLLNPLKHRLLHALKQYKIYDENNQPLYRITLTHSLIYRDCFKHLGQHRYVIVNNENKNDDFLLGKGSYAKVYECDKMLVPNDNALFTLKERKPDKHFAAKIQPLDKTHADAHYAESRNTPAEYQPHAVQFDEKEKVSCLLMKKLPGCTLDKFIEKMEEAKKLQYTGLKLIQLGLCLLKAYKAQLYDRHFVHCDLKPSNILVQERPDTVERWLIHIIDHAFAIPADQERYVEQGTPLYAPTDLRAHHKYDVYALGLILIEIFQDFHRRQFNMRQVRLENKHGVELDRKVLFKGMKLSKSMEKHLKQLIKHMLDQNVANRPDFPDVLQTYEAIAMPKLTKQHATFFANKKKPNKAQNDKIRVSPKYALNN